MEKEQIEHLSNEYKNWLNKFSNNSCKETIYELKMTIKEGEKKCMNSIKMFFIPIEYQELKMNINRLSFILSLSFCFT